MYYYYYIYNNIIYFIIYIIYILGWFYIKYNVIWIEYGPENIVMYGVNCSSSNYYIWEDHYAGNAIVS
jgi:hypothetical protein